MHRGIEGFDMPAPDDVRRAAEALRMLADPTRLNILWALMQGETSVACLAELAGTSPTAVSQHLSKLRLAGLVTNRREGAYVFYAFADHHIGELVRQALSHAGHRTGRTHDPVPAVGRRPASRPGADPVDPSSAPGEGHGTARGDPRPAPGISS